MPEDARVRSELTCNGRRQMGMMRRAVSSCGVGGRCARPSRPAAPPRKTPKRGGTLNFSVVAEPPNYDCHGSTTFALIHPIAPHYSLLVKFDGKDYPKVVPDLAESWTVAPDGMSYTFKLRSGVKFHDGSPLTSEDVKATTSASSTRRRAWSRSARPTTPISPSRRPDRDDGRLQAEEPDGGRARGARLAVQLHLQRRQAQAKPALSRDRDHGLGPLHARRACARHQLGGKRFDGYFDKGKPYLDGYKAFFVKSNAVVPGIIGRPVRRRVPRPQSLREEPAAWTR